MSETTRTLSLERQLFRRQAAVVASAIQLFMVRGRDVSQFLKASHRAEEYSRCELSVPQDLPFGFIRLARLFEDRIRDSHFAEVVQVGGMANDRMRAGGISIC